MLSSSLINYQIAVKYIQTDGKTRALFGIIEIVTFSFQYYVLILPLISFCFIVLAKWKNKLSFEFFYPIFLFCISIGMIFLRIWRLYLPILAIKHTLYN
jgi:hypothetical protein